MRHFKVKQDVFYPKVQGQNGQQDETLSFKKKIKVNQYLIADTPNSYRTLYINNKLFCVSKKTVQS